MLHLIDKYRVTYLNTSSFIIYLVPYALKRRIAGQAGTGYEPVVMEPGLTHTPSVDEGLPPLTVRETRELALVFCFLWFLANWSLNAALDYTSVASATILSSMSGLFTLVVGRIFQVETLTFAKVLAPSNLLMGDFLALVSAIVYGLYVTLLKVRIHFESRIDMQLFFGFVGLFNVLTCWVIGVLLHILGIEPFELPTSNVAIRALIYNMFITLSSDYLYVVAMLKTTPLVVTIGLTLTIPLAVIGDLSLGKTVHFLVLVGASIVVFSFVMVGLDDARSLSFPEIHPALKKREKMQATHDALMQGLEKSSSPYSKSHARRMKRKAKEQIANGLDDMRTALAALDQDIPTLIEQPETKTSHVEPQRKKLLKVGLVGEGKKATLSNLQRKRALQMERVRHPLILANPDFASNPFQAIRTHAQNTLVKREPSS
ncbi:hypothetical protein C0993_001534 [Termitomyces sp. T159_Od127]|nr:hypothetical protein C0993_001534 [Termitomyces sp. T159_Od127]